MLPGEQVQSTPLSFLGHSVLLSVLFGLESAVGFVVDVIVAAAFGLSANSDALYAAWMLPKSIGRGIFTALTNAFLGLFAEQQDLETAYNEAVAVIATAAFPLAALLSVSSFWWLPLTIPGATMETKLAAVRLASVMSWLVGFLALAETLRAICYREGKLWLPALARVLGGVLSGVLILFAAREQSLLWAAWGVTAGAALEAVTSLVGLPWVMRVRLRLQWPSASALREVVSLVGASLSGPAMWIGAEATERGLASLLPPGSIAALSYARRMVNTLTQFVFRGFVISTIQTQVSEIKARFRARARLVVLVAIPLSIVLAVLPRPLVAVAFGRRGFTPDDVQTLARTLQVYAPAILVIAVGRIHFGLAYAQKRARTILIHFALCSLGLVLGDAILVHLGLGLRAFGLGYALAQGIGLAWLSISAPPGQQRDILAYKDLLQLLVVGLSAWLGAHVLASLAEHWTAGFRWTDWLVLAAGTMGCGVSLLVAAWVLKLDEVRQLQRLAGRRRL